MELQSVTCKSLKENVVTGLILLLSNTKHGTLPENKLTTRNISCLLSFQLQFIFVRNAVRYLHIDLEEYLMTFQPVYLHSLLTVTRANGFKLTELEFHLT